MAVLLAAVGAALTFAAAHHVGPNGEEMVPAKFLFRALAGLYFTALYVVRGFGVAVGRHAGYDVLVGRGGRCARSPRPPKSGGGAGYVAADHARCRSPPSTSADQRVVA